MALFKKASPAAGKIAKSGAPVLVASDVVAPDGGVIYSKQQVAEAIQGFAEGKQLQQQGESLQETHKPVLSEFARRGFAKAWVEQGVRPKSPKLTTDSSGTGTFLTMSFIDRQVLVNDQQLNELRSTIGDDADNLIEEYTEYKIDAKIAAQTAKIKGEEATFQEHIEKALLEYFPEEHHETIASMLKPKEVRQTKKGMLDRLINYAGRGATAPVKLAELLLKSRVITAYKAGNVADSDD